MSTIKQDRKDLEALLNGISPIQSSPMQNAAGPAEVNQPVSASVVDATAGTPLNEEKLFDFDIDSVRKGLRKKARKTVLNMVKHILSDDMIEEDYIQDKIEQDIETLADLYVQVESNKIMQGSLINAVSRGNTTPRLYEVFGQLTDKISGLTKQIIATEQTIRKTYVDLKFEIRDKIAEDTNKNVLLNGSSAPKQLENNSVVVASSRDLNNLAKQRHRESLENAALKNAKETTYTEE